MLSDCTALDEKINAQYQYLNELTTAMQNFIKENALHPQSEDFYNQKMAEYEQQKSEGEKVLKAKHCRVGKPAVFPERICLTE